VVPTGGFNWQDRPILGASAEQRPVIKILLSIGVLIAGTVLPPQPPIRSAARTVAVYATVTDASGRLVTDLTREDFEVYDNGKRQPITMFESGVQPITVVMLLDRSGSMAVNFRLVEVAARQFVTRMLPEDRARIGSFANRIQIDPRDFSSSQPELLRILGTELQPAGPTPLWNAVNVGITALLRQEGRRVILVFTDGVDRPMNNSSVSLNEVMKRSQQEDVMVYAIGLSSRFPAPRGSGGTGGRRRMIVQKPDAGLKKVAAESGGGYFELTSANDLGPTFARVADELHQQYLMGFEPPALDGKTHKIEVKVKRIATVRARRSYVAARE
jgi:Ca-activated chloride channel family protein